MHEKNGNDATLVRNSVEGHVVYFKEDYGFIKPDDRNFDDLFFHVNDVEPGREGFVEFNGRVRGQTMQDESGNEVVVQAFPGERVRFDIKESGKTIVDKRTGVKKKGYKAINIEILSEYKPKTFTKKF
jgi:cold shock CspA family protein